MDNIHMLLEDDPHLYKWLILAVLLLIGLTFPLLAQEAENEHICHNCDWDDGFLMMPIVIKTEIANISGGPELRKVKSYGNGTCVPYARERTGIELFGWARNFLREAKKNGYTVTEVPQIGCMVITNEGGGHVAVVEDITDKGILISEQNYVGLFVVSNRYLDPDNPVILGYIY